MTRIARRRFLSASGMGVAGSTFGLALPSAVRADAISAGDRVVLALVGCGSRGTAVTRGLTAQKGVILKNACDCDAARRERAAKAFSKPQGPVVATSDDMRTVLDDPDVDAVVVGTPEHWHALAGVWACQAGKDVYVEKCPTLTIWEGRKFTEAARKYKRIVQVGTQNRSAPYAHSAREYIKNGGLGKVIHVKVFNMLNGGGWSPMPDSAAPADLDWDKWLGPAPKVPYNAGRHNSGGARGWGNWWAYSGCPLSDDGSHNLDLARIAVDDPVHPSAVYSAGGRVAFKDRRETPDMLASTFDYGDWTMTVECATFMPYTRKSGGDVRFHDKFPHWPQNSTRIEIYGTRRMMYLGRHGGGWQVFEGNAKVTDFEYGRFPDPPHQRNFIDCIRSRKRPNGDIEQGHYSATLVHLANVAHRVGNRRLAFDGDTETFPHSDTANRLLKPAYRDPYRIPDNV